MRAVSPAQRPGAGASRGPAPASSGRAPGRRRRRGSPPRSPPGMVSEIGGGRREARLGEGVAQGVLQVRRGRGAGAVHARAARLADAEQHRPLVQLVGVAPALAVALLAAADLQPGDLRRVGRRGGEQPCRGAKRSRARASGPSGNTRGSLTSALPQKCSIHKVFTWLGLCTPCPPEQGCRSRERNEMTLRSMPYWAPSGSCLQLLLGAAGLAVARTLPCRGQCRPHPEARRLLSRGASGPGRGEPRRARRARSSTSAPTPAREKLRGARTRVIDLAGRAVTPGLIDAHSHLAGLGAGPGAGRPRRAPPAIEEVVRRVREAAARGARRAPGSAAAAGTRTAGRRSGSPPTRRCSAAVPDHPVWLEPRRRPRRPGQRPRPWRSWGSTPRRRTPRAAASCATRPGSPPACWSTTPWAWSEGRAARRPTAADRERALAPGRRATAWSWA